MSGLSSSSRATLSVVPGIPTAYARARFAFPPKNALAFLFMRFGFVPFIALVFLRYLLDQRVALSNTRTGLIVVYQPIAFPFVVRMLRIFFQKIPLEILEAATIDERSRLGVLTRVIPPRSLPGIGHGLLERLQLSADARPPAGVTRESRGQFISYEQVLVGTNGDEDHRGGAVLQLVHRSLADHGRGAMTGIIGQPAVRCDRLCRSMVLGGKGQMGRKRRCGF